MLHQFIPYEGNTTNHPVDVNHPRKAALAVEGRFPTTFSQKARSVIEGLGSTAFLFIYQGKFVVTDETLTLSPSGNDAPRWVGDSLEDLEAWLEGIADQQHEEV